MCLLQVVTHYSDAELPLVLEACERMQHHLTAAIVSNDILFNNQVRFFVGLVPLPQLHHSCTSSDHTHIPSQQSGSGPCSCLTNLRQVPGTSTMVTCLMLGLDICLQ